MPCEDPADQPAIDKVMLDLDGTENKTNLGANAILGRKGGENHRNIWGRESMFHFGAKSCNDERLGDSTRILCDLIFETVKRRFLSHAILNPQAFFIECDMFNTFPFFLVKPNTLYFENIVTQLFEITIDEIGKSSN